MTTRLASRRRTRATRSSTNSKRRRPKRRARPKRPSARSNGRPRWGRPTPSLSTRRNLFFFFLRLPSFLGITEFLPSYQKANVFLSFGNATFSIKNTSSPKSLRSFGYRTNIYLISSWNIGKPKESTEKTESKILQEKNPMSREKMLFSEDVFGSRSSNEKPTKNNNKETNEPIRCRCLHNRRSASGGRRARRATPAPRRRVRPRRRAAPERRRRRRRPVSPWTTPRRRWTGRRRWATTTRRRARAASCRASSTRPPPPSDRYVVFLFFSLPSPSAPAPFFFGMDRDQVQKGSPGLLKWPIVAVEKERSFF